MQKFQLTGANTASIPSAKVLEDTAQVDARLQSLHSDLSLSFFTNIISQGLAARNEATAASAPTAAGQQQWLKTVEPLRTELAGKRWVIKNLRNSPLILSPSRDIAIAVMTGCPETGIHRQDVQPSNQAEKGAVTAGFIEQNRQLELFQAVKAQCKKQDGTQVWVLLYHYEKQRDEVRFELSLPTDFDKKKITQWGERLLLGRISNASADFMPQPEAPHAPVDVTVVPKQAG